MENTGFLGVARQYFLRIIFSKIFTDLYQHSIFADSAKKTYF